MQIAFQAPNSVLTRGLAFTVFADHSLIVLYRVGIGLLFYDNIHSFTHRMQPVRKAIYMVVKQKAKTKRYTNEYILVFVTLSCIMKRSLKH